MLLTGSNGGENDFSRIRPVNIVFRNPANAVVDLDKIGMRRKDL